ncbi:hypothetical protein ACFQWC_13480 [Rossellomorea sp. GCM10028870]|uniref:hypothetical protein n=1 Tax=Rossellomorea sp. GCM10028870 TaxID=3273426 RepID=UPI00361F566D
MIILKIKDSYALSEWTGFKNGKLIAIITTIILMAFVIYTTHDIQMGYELFVVRGYR